MWSKLLFDSSVRVRVRRLLSSELGDDEMTSPFSEVHTNATRPSAMFSAFYCYCTILFKLVMPSRRSLAARAAVPVLASLLSFHRYEKPQQIRKTMKPFCLSNSASACRCRSLKILVEARFSSRRSMPTISKMTNLLRFQHFLDRFGGSRVG